MRPALAILSLALLVFGSAVGRAETAETAPEAATLASSAFDPPLEVKHVDLGPADTVPPQQKEVRCSYFSTFMAKEVDEREVGAAQLSLLPATPEQRPLCQRDNLPGEQVINDKAWRGYFAGAHGDYAIFSAEDGEHGGLGFAVIRPADAKILYSAVTAGELTFSTAADGATALHFEAIHAGSCSVEVKGNACATKIGREAGIPAPAVELCHHGYQAAKHQVAQDRCASGGSSPAKGCVDKQVAKLASWDTSPSVVTFAMDVVLGPNGATAHPTSAAFVCWPAE